MAAVTSTGLWPVTDALYLTLPVVYARPTPRSALSQSPSVARWLFPTATAVPTASQYTLYPKSP